MIKFLIIPICIMFGVYFAIEDKVALVVFSMGLAILSALHIVFELCFEIARAFAQFEESLMKSIQEEMEGEEK